MWTDDDAAVAAVDRVGASCWVGVLDEVEQRVARHVVRPETAAGIGAMTLSLMGDLERKNCWTLGEHAGCSHPWGMQHLLARGAWDTDGVGGELRGLVAGHLGEP